MPERLVWSLHSPKTCWRPRLRWDTDWHRGWDMGRGRGKTHPTQGQREKGLGTQQLKLQRGFLPRFQNRRDQGSAAGNRA